MQEKITLKIIYKGKVQGVFFREYVKRYAKKYNILGTIKNLMDGSVEVVAVADDKSLEKFMRIIQEKPGLGFIESIEKKEISKMNFQDFEIIY